MMIVLYASDPIKEILYINKIKKAGTPSSRPTCTTALWLPDRTPGFDPVMLHEPERPGPAFLTDPVGAEASVVVGIIHRKEQSFIHEELER